MPELLEAEIYRRTAESVVGRRIERSEAPDAWVLKEGLDPAHLVDVLTGAVVEAVRRHGKVVIVDLDDRPPLGLHFGMTGRLLVDGAAAIDQLVYGSGRDDPAWDRLRVHFAGGGALALRDPRRLARITLDPDLTRLGPDAGGLTAAALRRVLGARKAPLKAVLMDQSRVAGLGNLLTDECLWRAGLDPNRPAGSLEAREVRRLHHHLRATLRALGERGGSHTGDLMPERHRDGVCPRHATPLRRDQVGGRTTYWCPAHQH